MRSSKRKQIKQSYADNTWCLVTIHCSNADQYIHKQIKCIVKRKMLLLTLQQVLASVVLLSQAKCCIPSS